MHLSYVLATAMTVLTTVSSFPHWHAGKRHLDGYGPGPVKRRSPQPLVASGTASYSPTGFPTYTGFYPTDTAGTAGTGTGTGFGSPTYTGIPPTYPNATSSLAPVGPTESAITVGRPGPIAPTACLPATVLTITQSISFTVTVTAPVISPIGTAPLPSASLNSAPFPLPGNSTLGGGPTGTGTGTGLPGTGLPGTGLPGTGKALLPTPIASLGK